MRKKIILTLLLTLFAVGTWAQDAPAGEYTVRIWVKSNHDVNCTIKVISTLEE